MQDSRFTAPKGFVFSVDAAVSIIMLITAFFLLLAQPFEHQKNFENVLQTGSDSISTIAKTGYLSETLDSNSLSQSAVLIRQKIAGILPKNLDVRIELAKYDLNTIACKSTQDFDSCFLQTAPLTAADGPALPQKDVFSSKQLLVLGQEPGSCDLDVALKPKQEELLKQSIAFFSQQEPLQQIYLQQENPLQIDFNVTVNPADVLVCDQNVQVTLTVTVPQAVRPPIDMMLVIDRSGSMSWNGHLDTTDAQGVRISSSNAFVADATSGVRSINISNPFIPTLQNTLDTTNALKAFIRGTVLFLADGSSGVRSINISNPANITLLDSYDPGTVIDIYGDGNFVFLADISFTDELIAIDATNPSNLLETDQLNFDFVSGLFVDANYAYVAGERAGGTDSGLVIVDVNTPGNIQLRGLFNTTDPNHVFVDGNFAFLADGTAGLKVFEVSNKNSPQLTGSVDTPSDATRVFVDENYAYVTDASKLLKINVADKNNIFIERTYPSPYIYRDVFVQNDLAFIAADSIGLVVIDLIDGQRLFKAQEAAKLFVDFNGWVLPPDKIGLASFSSTATLNQALTTVKLDLNTAIDSLVSSGSTNIESGINTATTELTGPNANPVSLKFQVLLSDGQSTTGNSATAAQTAANNNITIFTVGFGADAAVAELTNIANLTGGLYYSATDENALQDIFELIAAEIAERASDVNVSVPALGGALVLDQGSGVLVDGNLVFDAGELISGEPWSATYTLNFPCSNINNCGVDAITLPGEGAYLTYIDSNGFSHTIDFNSQKTLDFHKRDLNVTIDTATIISESEVYIDVTVKNVAELDANSTDINFFITDTNGTPVATATVPSLCSPQTPGCTQSESKFSSFFIPNSGKIYATIGDGSQIRECPAGNTDAVYCSIGAPAEFIEIKYFVWRK